MSQKPDDKRPPTYEERVRHISRLAEAIVNGKLKEYRQSPDYPSWIKKPGA